MTITKHDRTRFHSGTDLDTNVTIDGAIGATIDDGDTLHEALVALTALAEAGGGAVPYTLELDDVGGGVTYVGEAAPGTAVGDPLWRIKKITETGPDVVVAWADGSADFDKIWDDRATYTYS